MKKIFVIIVAVLTVCHLGMAQGKGKGQQNGKSEQKIEKTEHKQQGKELKKDTVNADKQHMQQNKKQKANIFDTQVVEVIREQAERKGIAY